MFHIGMVVRFTRQVEKSLVCVDQPGVVGIDFHEHEPWDNRLENQQKSVVVLRYFPTAIYVRLLRDDDDPVRLHLLKGSPCPLHEATGVVKDCIECRDYGDVVAVAPVKDTQAFTLDLKVRGELVAVKVYRKQFPIVCRGPSTEHVLRGSTCDPGLIFHWFFPRRLIADMRWLAVYVALSRVRSLAGLKSRGLNNKILALQ